MRDGWMKMRLFLLAGLLLGAIPVGSALGSPLTLEDLDNGASFISGDGLLEFSGFSITTSGSVSSPLSGFEVLVLEDGFDVVDTWSAFSGESGGMRIEYNVAVTDDDLWLKKAMLSFNGASTGDGSEAFVVETLGTLTAFEVFAQGDDLQLSSEVILFPGDWGKVRSLDVVKEISVVSGSDGTAQISVVTNRFEVVPEPGTAALFLLGLGGLLVARLRS